MPNRAPRRSESVIRRRVAEEAFLVPIAGNLADLRGLYALNAVADFVWERLDGTRTVPELATEVCGAFEVDLETARNDIDGLLGKLGELGFLEHAA